MTTSRCKPLIFQTTVISAYIITIKTTFLFSFSFLGSLLSKNKFTSKQREAVIIDSFSCLYAYVYDV